MQLSRRGFLAGLLGTAVIAVIPNAAAPVEAAVETVVPPIDPFAITAPPGWTYQWVRCALLGEPDPENVQARIDNNWTFVEPAAHPGAPVSTAQAAIEACGLILMQKPTADIIASVRHRT
jgi:hypothetical protein